MTLSFQLFVIHNDTGSDRWAGHVDNIVLRISLSSSNWKIRIIKVFKFVNTKMKIWILSNEILSTEVPTITNLHLGLEMLKRRCDLISSSHWYYNFRLLTTELCKYKYWQVSLYWAIVLPVRSVDCNKYKYKLQWALLSTLHPPPSE